MSGTRSEERKAESTRFSEQLGIRLRDMREAHKVSQTEMGLRIGFSKTHISNCELGKTMISAEILYRYCKEFDVSVDKVFSAIKLDDK